MQQESQTNWQQIYRDHAAAVLAYLRSRAPSEEAEDLLQETFVRAIRSHQRRGEVTAVTNFRPYLLTVARNLLLNRIRDAATADPALRGEALTEEVASAEATPHQRADFYQLGDRLRRLLDGMSDSHRQAFELAVLQQRPYKEVARKTGWPLSRVKVNVHRARQHALRELDDYLP